MLHISSLISNKHENVCKYSNYTKHLLNFVSAVTASVSISAFTSLVGISCGITSFRAAVKVCSLIAGIKKYMLIIKKTKKNSEK